MTTHYVTYRGSRADIDKIVGEVQGMLTGAKPDDGDIAKGFLYSLGFLALSDIKAAYIVKARGGTDEMGVSWPPLSPEYLAYGRRFGPGEQAALKRAAGLGGKHRHAPGKKKGLLSMAQYRQWAFLFRAFYLQFRDDDPAGSKSHAAAVAWVIMKKRGARTKLEVFGKRVVDILRDTGVLLNSLSPGILTTSTGSVSYGKPAGDGGAEQVFRMEPGAIIVGTNVKYASAHQGKDAKPQRLFLPDEQHPVPLVWWDRWVAGANKALAFSVAAYLRRKGGME